MCLRRPRRLERTVRDTNRFARTGVDEEFGKGTSVFGHQYGDRTTPNVNLGPIETAPFSAIAVLPTPLGTALGLRTDPSAHVLDEAGAPIPGLYACGNDAQSVMASEYPGAGCQVGAGLAFGYVAARLRGGTARGRVLTPPSPTLRVVAHPAPRRAPSMRAHARRGVAGPSRWRTACGAGAPVGRGVRVSVRVR